MEVSSKFSAPFINLVQQRLWHGSTISYMGCNYSSVLKSNSVLTEWKNNNTPLFYVDLIAYPSPNPQTGLVWPTHVPFVAYSPLSQNLHQRSSMEPYYMSFWSLWPQIAGNSSRWLHPMKTFSALLANCAGNSPVPGECPTQRPVTRSFMFSLICVWITVG